MTATTSTTSTKTAKTSLATSAKFGIFATVFAIAFPVVYVLCDIFNLALFTFHPATYRIEWGAQPGRSGQGPAMYWYGWTATTLIGSFVLGLVATMLPGGLTKRIPLALVWLLPVLAVPFLVYSLMPFWTK